jgi:hypothetical protein
MSTIVTRAGKGSPLTWNEVDNNFTNLNTDKLQSGNTAAALTITSATINGGTITGTALNGTLGATTPSTIAATTISASGVSTFSAGSAGAPAITTAGDTNTGIFFPAADTIAFSEGGTESMRIDSSGNVGLGVTPSAWGSGWKALQFGSGGSAFTNGTTDARIGANTYQTGSTFAAINTGAASRYEQVAGGHYWLNAPSVSAGVSQSFTQAMTLDTSGNLGIGATSPARKLEIAEASNNYQMRIGAGSVSASYTYDIGRSNSDGFLYFYGNQTGANGYVFSGANGERMRIDASGNLLVNNTAYSAGNGNYFLAGAGGVLWVGHINGTASSTAYENFQYNGSTIGSITQNGTTAVAYNTSSDYRLKENIAPMTGALATVAKLKPVTYNWKSDGSDGQGFIAHELQEVVPDCVTGEKDATREEEYEISPAIPAVLDDEGVEVTPAVEAVMGTRTVPVYQGIDTSFLVATLTAAIQEQQAMIDELKAKVAALEAA